MEYDNRNQYGGQDGYGNRPQYGGRADREYGRGFGLTPAARALKDCGGSVVFLLAAAFYSAAFLVRLYQSMELWPYLDAYLEVPVGVLTVAEYVLVLAAGALISAGLWMFFAACRKSAGPAPSGLGFIKAGIVLDILYYIMAVGAFICVLFYTSGSGGWISIRFFGLNLGTALGGALLPAALIICMLALAVLIVYHVKAATTAGTAAAVCRTGWADKKLSMYVVVVNFIMIAAALFGIFDYAANGPGTGGLGTPADMAGVIRSVLDCGAVLCVNISILQFRGRLISGR